MKKVVKRVLLGIAALLFIVVLSVGGLVIHSKTYSVEEQVATIENTTGLVQMNTIRLPFYYLNVLNEDLSLKEEEEAFAYLDWFVEQAAKQELYVVLDLHGAPGSQNGFGNLCLSIIQKRNQN